MSNDQLSCPSPSSEYFFEGAEKLLEVWFGKRSSNRDLDSGSDREGSSDEEDQVDHCDLRLIPRSTWESILKLVKCEVMSFKRYEHIDSYVLSESSMFVSKNRFIIKTCGNIMLLRCLEPLIYLAKEMAGFDEVLDVFYSRKNFLRPELQQHPHDKLTSETELLDSYFEDGAAYCMGLMNADHWFFYTLNPLISGDGVRGPDQTLEVIMQNLSPDVMKIFTRDICSDAKEATVKSGIDKLIPGAVIDAVLFDPCGYSMNGYIKGGYYMTIHITPEAGFSYVSFETNYPQSSYTELIGRVIKTFQPGTFLVTILANEVEDENSIVDVRPESLKKLLQAKDLLTGLLNLEEEELAIYNESEGDRITTNKKLTESLKNVFGTGVSNQTQIRLYDKYIRSCFKRIYLLQFHDLPEIWKATIHDLTTDYIGRIINDCAMSKETDTTEASDIAADHLKLLLIGPCVTEEHRLSLLSLKMVRYILDLVLPEDREMDEDYFTLLHEFFPFYNLVKTIVNSWRHRRDFVDHERDKMIELLKEMIKMVEDRNFHIHEKCPLIQVELVEIMLYLQLLVEFVQRA